MATGVKRQLSMVMDLNKCIGCHTCTSACKMQWTNRNGREYMYWNNVETRPGRGYPRDFESMGGVSTKEATSASAASPARRTTASHGSTTSKKA